MLTLALANRLKDTLVTANALNPGYVLTELTTSVGGLLKILVLLTSFKAETALDGADTAIWLAAGPGVEGRTGQFWNRRREVRCKFRDPAAMEQLWRLVEEQVDPRADGAVNRRRPRSRKALSR
jgi:NAD(P)-dependent dehydrogenase (short-subunit alcohol dehydrogenase family)